jgi:invasion protein IalB
MHLHKFSVRCSSAALLLLAAAAPVAAADPASAPSNQASVAAPAHSVKSQPNEPKKICRTIESISSRLKGKRVCLTREQWRNAKYN